MAPRKKKSAAGPPPSDPCSGPSEGPASDREHGQQPEADGQPMPEADASSSKPVQRAGGRRGKKKSGSHSVAVYEKMVGAILSAYVFDAIGHLSPHRRQLVELMSQEDPDWPFVIESAYGINRTLIRSVYALWTEHFSSAEAVLFLLRGLDCPGGKALEELVEEEFGS
jgi:hypothetical protein